MYGMLKALAIEREGSRESGSHYQLLCGLGDDRWRVALNAAPGADRSVLEYTVADSFSHPLLGVLPELADGWTPIGDATGSRHFALDFIRANLVQPRDFRTLGSSPRIDHALDNLLDFHLVPLVGDPEARVYAYGSLGLAPSRDPYFGFTPGRVVHDVHQQQGNAAFVAPDDAPWRDGGVITQSAAGWSLILLRFTSQAWHTDDLTGHALPGAHSSGPRAASSPLRIVAAAIVEGRVLVLNRSHGVVDARGWRLVGEDRATELHGSIQPGAMLAADVALTPGGGRLSLIDSSGRKAHGVAYTAADAQRRDRMIDL
jgi:uncharacterized protein YukJ